MKLSRPPRRENSTSDFRRCLGGFRRSPKAAQRARGCTIRQAGTTDPEEGRGGGGFDAATEPEPRRHASMEGFRRRYERADSIMCRWKELHVRRRRSRRFRFNVSSRSTAKCEVVHSPAVAGG